MYVHVCMYVFRLALGSQGHRIGFLDRPVGIAGTCLYVCMYTCMYVGPVGIAGMFLYVCTCMYVCMYLDWP